MVSSFKAFCFLFKPFKHWAFIIDHAATVFLRYSHFTLILFYINKLSYSVIFIKKINLLQLHHWCFPGKLINFSEATTRIGILKNFCNIHRKVAQLQPYQEETPARMFSSEYCKIFKNIYFEELTAASDFLKQQQNISEQLLLYSLLF